MAKTKRRLSESERAERRAQDRQRLRRAAEQLLSSEGWWRWVRARAGNGLARYRLDNLELLCPNCHSQAENFSGRNRASPGGGRVVTALPSAGRAGRSAGETFRVAAA